MNGNGGKPIVGVVGEIYVRSNRFSNENAVREIEALGGEVWMPPISEWLLYVNYTTKHEPWTPGATATAHGSASRNASSTRTNTAWEKFSRAASRT